jgi:hypothetical protein
LATRTNAILFHGTNTSARSFERAECRLQREDRFQCLALVQPGKAKEESLLGLVKMEID